MKKLFFLSLFSISTLIAANPPVLAEPAFNLENEVQELDRLILATEKQMAQITSLRQTIASYQSLQQKFMEHSDDKKLGYEMIQLAFEIEKGIEKSHIEKIFDREFIKEIQFFSKMAEKNHLPLP